MAFKIHKMYHKDGDVEVAKTNKEHLALKKKGYNHNKPKKK
jgi:hypothetical protein|tara:strand:- start:823 stop:945 length:123 start_codon:yes stop_codon:yes gene_type:complete